MVRVTTLMEPNDRWAAIGWLFISVGLAVFFYCMAAMCAAIYRERPIVSKDPKTGRYTVHRDLRQRR